MDQAHCFQFNMALHSTAYLSAGAQSDVYVERQLSVVQLAEWIASTLTAATNTRCLEMQGERRGVRNLKDMTFTSNKYGDCLMALVLLGV